MQVTVTHINDTRVKLTIVGSNSEFAAVKQGVLARAATNQKIQGFREGKAPLALVEKQIDPNVLQTEFLDEIVNRLYGAAINQENLRPVEQPNVTIKKFVPFTALEFEAEFEAVGKITVGDYKKLKLAKPMVKVVAKDIDDVLENLRTRIADKKEVTRASKDGDQVLIDFKGADAKTKEPINGADGEDYPLVIGSNSFIPGFEPNLIGLKAGETKSFTITFPKDYGVAALQNRKVEFTVDIKKVEAFTLPKVDDTFAAKVGPFKTVDELKADIKKQVLSERQAEADRAFENELITEITNKSKVIIPKVLVEEQLDQMEQQERQNLTYRGQTWQEHLKEEGITEAQHREKNRAQAETRVKAGLVLSEIAEAEKITITPEDLEVRMQLLKGQYKDPTMQAELDKPETRRDILSRMITEKTLEKLATYVTA